MTDEELEKLVETQLLSSKKEIIKALKTFQANPDATTFRQAEDIPDELVGRSLDRIIGAVLSETSLNFHAVPHDSQKKMGKPRTPEVWNPAEARRHAGRQP